ncbi:MAG: hypothetical protein ACMUHX_06230 [bacterium]
MRSILQILKNRISSRLLCFLILAVFLSLAGCANRLPEPCVKDGRAYCVTDEWIFSENWYSCYLRGISCIQGGCWENAKDEFLRAANKREVDGRWVRTYGMHRLPEYFPNRELGIAYYHLNDLDSALKYLMISLDQCESAKAKLYINKVRKEKLLLTREDRESPQLSLDLYPRTIAATEFVLSGLARDDTFVADVLIQVNGGELKSLLELSQPKFKTFQQKVFLRTGINDILIRVVDLLGKHKEEIVRILVDQEGPMIFFAKPGEDDPSSLILVKGLVYDPSDVIKFYLNGRRVALNLMDDFSEEESGESYRAYSFQCQLSLQEWQRGILIYEAEDSLKNKTSGSMNILKEEHPAYHEQIRIAMASGILTSDSGKNSLLYQTASRRSLDPIRINISQLPEETFNEEICPQIEILAQGRIKEITINDEPILSIYGLHWSKFFNRVFKKYIEAKEEGRFLFNRMIRLKEGKNAVHIKVVDVSGKVWERSVPITKKIKKIHQLEERWRIAIPFITQNQYGDHDQNKMKRDLTYQLIEAFIDQGRFSIIELEDLPLIVDEKSLSYHLGRPFLGLSSESGIWIDTFLLGYIQEAEDSITLSASMVDLETGVILATKDVCEEIDTSELVWQEGLREHAFHICSILAAKFKAHFPICEGDVISLTGEELKTGICKDDGLKEGMKLILYTGKSDIDEDFVIIGDAKVKTVKREYSLADLLQDPGEETKKGSPINWGVITR